jgi:hypothetical protein
VPVRTRRFPLARARQPRACSPSGRGRIDPASVMRHPPSNRSTRPCEKISRLGARAASGGAFRPLPPAGSQDGHVALDVGQTRPAVGVTHQHLEDDHLKVSLRAHADTQGPIRTDPTPACRVFPSERKPDRRPEAKPRRSAVNLSGRTGCAACRQWLRSSRNDPRPAAARPA